MSHAFLWRASTIVNGCKECLQGPYQVPDPDTGVTCLMLVRYASLEHGFDIVLEGTHWYHVPGMTAHGSVTLKHDFRKSYPRLGSNSGIGLSSRLLTEMDCNLSSRTPFPPACSSSSSTGYADGHHPRTKLPSSRLPIPQLHKLRLLPQAQSHPLHSPQSRQRITNSIKIRFLLPINSPIGLIPK